MLSSCLLISYLPDVAKTSVFTQSHSHIDGKITNQVTFYPLLHSKVEALGAFWFTVVLHITGSTTPL